MAFPNGVDPSGTLIMNSSTIAALCDSINEKENYMGYDPETSWSTGAPRPALNAFVGKPKHEVMAFGAGDNIKLARDILDTSILTNTIDGWGSYAPVEDIAGWTEYADFADLYNTALGAGVGWETATAALGGVPYADVTVVKEMMSVVAELKAFIYHQVATWWIPPGIPATDYSQWGIRKVGVPYTTSTAIYNAAVAGGIIPGLESPQTSWWLDYDIPTDRYVEFYSDFFVFRKPATMNGPTDPAPTTMEGALEYEIPTPPPPVYATANATYNFRPSNAAEYAAAAWVAVDPVPLITIVWNVPVTPAVMTAAVDFSTDIDFSADSFFRVDFGTANPFAVDPNHDEGLLWTDGITMFTRFASTNWTYE